MNEIAIQTEKLCRNFNGLRAVDELNLQVPCGTIFGFLGPNGAGKTTTIRLLLGVLEPTSGTAHVMGCDVVTQTDRVREQVGVLLERDGLYLRLSAWDNLDFYGEIYHLTGPERRSRIEQLLKHLELWDRRNEAVITFSKGMRQKLALARALLHRPALLFLDEPTSGLDALGAVAMRHDLIALTRQEGVTVFLTTHNLADAEKVCDRVAVINRGQLIVEGSPSEIGVQARQPCVEIVARDFTAEALIALEQLPFVQQVIRSQQGLTVFLKEQGDTAELVSVLVGHDARVEEIHRVNPSLEEAFVTLMKEQEQ
jgi:ABC-2 type transport system ATP-binding protein